MLESKWSKTRMIIVGLDLSLSDTGMSKIHAHLTPTTAPTGRKWHSIQKGVSVNTKQFETGDDYSKQDYLLKAIEEYCQGANIVYLEDHAFSRTLGKAFTRAELAGMVKHSLRTKLKIPVRLIKPNELKRFMGVSKTGKRVVGKKKDRKALMKQAVFANYGFLSDNDNIVDAYALARYGAAISLYKERLNYIHINPCIKEA